ncbi:MAG: DUF4386 domain-containing protein [Anaerolineae bacterium]|nr:DUF4386 domain-containing protein [Anaerolineae bacterium]
MTTGANPRSLNTTAKIVALLTLAMTVLAPFSMIYVPSTLIVPGDAAATAANIAASDTLFRLSMASDALVFLIEIALIAALYALLKPVDKTLSLAAAFSRLAMTVVQSVNLLNRFIPLQLLSGADYLTVFETGQLHALALLFLNLHDSVALIWGLFFGLHLAFLGYLVYKSGYISKIPGLLLIVAAFCYLIQSFGNLLFPQYAALFTTIGFLSMVELAFPLWLLIKGVKEPR